MTAYAKKAGMFHGGLPHMGNCFVEVFSLPNAVDYGTTALVIICLLSYQANIVRPTPISQIPPQAAHVRYGLIVLRQSGANFVFGNKNSTLEYCMEVTRPL